MATKDAVTDHHLQAAFLPPLLPVQDQVLGRSLAFPAELMEQ
jgi:hypothetical protein